MAIKAISHINHVASHINYLDNDDPKSLEVYCRKSHKVYAPTVEECQSCPYFAGFAGGYGRECFWEDHIPNEENMRNISWDDRYNELMRVSQLFDKGIIQKG